MIVSSRPIMMGLFAFFALGELLASTSSALASFLAFFSPLQWVSSLVVVMTGQISTVEGLLQVVAISGSELLSKVVTAPLSGLLGITLCIAVELVLGHARKASDLGGKLFMATFIPIWTALICYKALLRTSPAFQSFASGLESLPYEVRLSAGFGIVLFALIVPMLALLCTQVVEVILRPEKSYAD
jgi:hypothetical protein